MGRLKKIVWRIFVCLAVLFMLVTSYKIVYTIAVPNKLPSFFGYSTALVVSGSMEPTLSVGDLVICEKQIEYQVDDMIIYYDDDDKIFVLHRIVDKTEKGYITKGDFNPISDKNPVRLENVCGKVIVAIPNIKTIRDIAVGALSTLAIIYGKKLVIDYRKIKSSKKEEQNEKNNREVA